MRQASLELRPIRLKPRSDIEKSITIGARVAQMIVALVLIVVALDYGEVILAPIFLGVVIGMMFSPMARRIERLGVTPGLSALVIVLAFLLLLMVIGMGLALPLATWMSKLPSVWEGLKLQIADWKGALASFEGLQKQLAELTGPKAAVTVKVADDAGPVASVVTLGPTIVAELLLFFASIYFFVAVRDRFRTTVLSICITRRMRWRLAHFFRDVEILVSRYLLTITAVNFCLGVAVTLMTWLIGMPSPLLWGALAFVFNFVIYIGPALMTIVLLSASLALGADGPHILIAPSVYLAMHFVESNFITSHVLGVTMTMNPFVVFLAIAFWIWLWGPIGGFIAVPSLLVLYALLRNIIPLAVKPQQKAPAT